MKSPYISIDDARDAGVFSLHPALQEVMDMVCQDDVYNEEVRKILDANNVSYK